MILGDLYEHNALCYREHSAIIYENRSITFGEYYSRAKRLANALAAGGENIYSREVEETLLLHPAVAEAAVTGVPDPKWGESVKAFVSLKPGTSATEAELIEHCRASIASYKKPRSVEFMPALPRILSTNKIDKKKLREPYRAGRDRQVS